MPDLSREEVEHYVALGRQGRSLTREGKRQAAADSFGKQIFIFPGNYEPYLQLAMLAAGGGDEPTALLHLHEAVVRGFTDMRSVVRAEAWTGIGRPIAFRRLEDAVLAAVELERDWPAWDSFVVPLAPERPQSVVDRRERLYERIAEMSPVLGPRLTRMWNRLIDRAAAAMLEAYIDAHSDAADLEFALEQLVACYVGGPLREWRLLPSAPASRLGDVAALVLDRFPTSEMRPEALVGQALAANARRDRQGVLLPEAATAIRMSLEEVLSGNPDSRMAPIAVVGLVRTEATTGRMGRAATHLAWIHERYADRPEVVDRVQQQLGELALRVGGLPDFRATTLAGSAVAPPELHGKVVVVDFWATWCQACVEGFPSLRRIGERHGEDVVLLGINMDYRDDLTEEALRAWIEREQVPGDHVYDGLAWESRLVKAFGVHEIPFSVVVGPQGEILAVNEHGKQLEKAVRVALK